MRSSGFRSWNLCSESRMPSAGTKQLSNADLDAVSSAES
jgi:hypothetical protein